MKLKQNITVFKGVGIAVGMVVGSGLFGLPGLAIDIGGYKLALVGWLVAILIASPMIYIFIKLGMKFPKASGLSRYAKVALGDWGEYGVVAVLSGTYTIGIPALSLIGGSYLVKLLNLDFIYMYVFAVAILALATFVNLIGVKVSSWINNFSIIFIFILISILIFIYPKYFIDGINIFRNMSYSEIDFGKLSSVVGLLFWAFLGWENLSFGLEEFKNPKKTIPIVYWSSFLIVSIFYVLLAIIVSGASKSGLEMSGMSSIATLLESKELMGSFLIFLMVFVILSNANSWVFGASRLIYSAGENGILPRYLGKLNKEGNPKNSLISLFVFYSFVILVVFVFSIEPSKIIMVVSQNFFVLYIVSIIAYKKLFNSSADIAVLFLSSIIILFFIATFNLGLIYPMVLLSIGYLTYKRQKKEH